MNRNLLFLWVYGLVLLQGCAFQSDRIAGVEHLMDSLIKADKFSGAVVIGNKEGVIYQREGGLALREWNIPVEADTRFDIASLNKSFVGMIIMQLVEEGKLSLADEITDYLPLNSPYADSITIHQLLTHTSGLPDYDAIADTLKEGNFEKFKRLHFSNSEYIEFIGSLAMAGQPGAQFYYSNFAYHLLAILIEEVEGIHFSKILEKRICEPLELKHTYSPLNNYRIYDRLAGSYREVQGDFERTEFIDYSLGRRVFSNAEDLYKWGVEMIRPTLLSPSSQKRMLTNHIGTLNPQVSYGYGWVIFDGKADYRIGNMDVEGKYIVHGGSTDGYRSILVIQEKGNWIVSMLTNNGGKVNELAFAERIINLLNNTTNEF